jgi:hypothetical protein
MTSATSNAQLAARQSESEAILRRFVSKLSCSIDSATPRFYRLPWTVFDAHARTTLAQNSPEEAKSCQS